MTTETLTNNKKSTTTETSENNKKIARQTFEAFEKIDLSMLDKLINEESFKLHFPGVPDSLKLKDKKMLNTNYMKAFPDTKVSVDFQISEGEYVCSRVTYHGTHMGELQGIPATNKTAKVGGLAIQRIVDDKVVEEWDEFDQLSLMHQIDAIPELGASVFMNLFLNQGK